MKKIGIIGNGFVGRATSLLGCEGVEIVIYDLDPMKSVPVGSSPEVLTDCDLVFVCVPTPMNEDGSCNLDLVEEAVKEASKRVGPERVVIKSTVPVGTSNNLGVGFMPEFLTEANWENDFANCEYWVIGDDRYADQYATTPLASDTIKEVFVLAHKAGRINHLNFQICKTKEAELVKYVRNSFLATKVSFFSEVEEFCRNINVSYELIRDLTCLDPRINKAHTLVPGPDGKRGFGGTCFPKDVSSFACQQKKVGQKSYIIEAAIERNDKVDRTDKDWEEKGRSIV